MGMTGGRINLLKTSQAGVDRSRQDGRMADRRDAADGEAGHGAHERGIRAAGLDVQAQSIGKRCRVAVPVTSNQSDDAIIAKPEHQ